MRQDTSVDPVKHLYVLRHGKSDWDADYKDDFDRPLADRGVASAGRVGRFLAGIEETPEIVVASKALRAATTAEIAIKLGKWDCDLVLDDGLYGASSAKMLRTVRNLDDAFESAMIVGHEPVCSEFVSELIGSAWLRFPTAALARIDFDVDAWKDTGPGEGALVWFVIPRMLAAYARSLS